MRHQRREGFSVAGTGGGTRRYFSMTEPLPVLVESSLQIAWDFLKGSGELDDEQQSAEFLLRAINDLVLRGERRILMLSNRAIDAYRMHRQALAA
jgi:hypothetical protein